MRNSDAPVTNGVRFLLPLRVRIPLWWVVELQIGKWDARHMVAHISPL